MDYEYSDKMITFETDCCVNDKCCESFKTTTKED